MPCMPCGTFYQTTIKNVVKQLKALFSKTSECQILQFVQRVASGFHQLNFFLQSKINNGCLPSLFIIGMPW